MSGSVTQKYRDLFGGQRGGLLRMKYSVDHRVRIDAHLKGLVRDAARYTNLPVFVMRAQTCGVAHSL